MILVLFCIFAYIQINKHYGSITAAYPFSTIAGPFWNKFERTVSFDFAHSPPPFFLNFIWNTPPLGYKWCCFYCSKLTNLIPVFSFLFSASQPKFDWWSRSLFFLISYREHYRPKTLGNRLLLEFHRLLKQRYFCCAFCIIAYMQTKKT